MDQASYERYRRVKDGDIGALLSQVIVRNPPEKLKPQHYATLQLVDGKTCPFLNEGGMCNLQMKLGEKYLCNVCMTYPRFTNVIDGVLERSLSLSCPEAARVVLLDEQPMEFDEGEEELLRNIIPQVEFSCHDPQWTGKMEQLFWDMRSFAIGLLQNRQYTMDERMIVFGMCFERMQQQINGHARPSEVFRTLDTYNGHVQSGVYKDSLQDIPLQMMVKLQLVSALFNSRIGIGKYDELFSQAYSYLDSYFRNTTATTLEELTDSYLQAYQQRYLPFMSSHEYMLENFLVNEVFLSAFPLSKATYFQGYMKLAVVYSMAKTMLIGLSLNGTELTKEHVVDVVRAISFTVLHFPQYLTAIVEEMCANGQDNMPYMATLIAN